MDIGAYARIEDLSAILASTGINIPRLRGLRLMATEEKISEDEIKEIADSAEVDAVEDLVRACPPWSVGSSCHSYCNRTDRNLKRFLVYTEDEEGYKHPCTLTVRRLQNTRLSLKEWMTGLIQLIVTSTLKLTSLLWSSI